jgi:hypothetical protein
MPDGSVVAGELVYEDDDRDGDAILNFYSVLGVWEYEVYCEAVEWRRLKAQS